MLGIPIAERHLVFSERGKAERKPLVIRIFAPRRVDPALVSFPVAPGTAVCMMEFDGIPDETLGATYGADSLQALQLAADIEPVLKRLSHRYDFYFPNGEGTSMSRSSAGERTFATCSMGRQESAATITDIILAVGH